MNIQTENEIKENIFCLVDAIYWEFMNNLDDSTMKEFVIDDEDNKPDGTKHTEKGGELFDSIEERIKNYIRLKFVLTVKKESKYGNELIYPICERAKLIVKLFDDKKTFTPRHIEILKQLGFIFQHEEIKI